MNETYNNIDDAISTLIESYTDNPDGISVMKINVAKYFYDKKKPSDNRTFNEFLTLIDDQFKRKISLN